VATAISMFRNRLGPRSIVADRDNVRLTLPGLTLDLNRLVAGDILVTKSLLTRDRQFPRRLRTRDAPEFMLWVPSAARLFPPSGMAFSS